MKTIESSSDDDQVKDVRIQNELKKMQMSMELGTRFMNEADAKIPPHIEAKWLECVERFEREFANAVRISVYERIGKPAFRTVQDLNDSELPIELGKLRELLQSHSIFIDTVSEVPDRELYRFITQELIEVQIEDIRLPGMMTCFIYEEFHPNHEHDCRELCESLLKSILDFERGYYSIFLAPELQSGNDIISIKEAEKRIEFFRQCFSKIELRNLQLNNCEVHGLKSFVSFEVEYKATLMEGGSMLYKGEGIITMTYVNKAWKADCLLFPGFML